MTFPAQISFFAGEMFAERVGGRFPLPVNLQISLTNVT